MTWATRLCLLCVGGKQAWYNFAKNVIFNHYAEGDLPGWA